ncbi:HlyD family type I secretion periplasmic adaptor subunit [Legionella hackeliae]|uniref:Membrane fusion protein (MFP) family protein n=1 Tax=Legionella hackeliae TaxID=449 RepID=A0A0A8UV89_LEGHA|nr:HlyD family type I secretion periplasmic adaptor subunit [Legionella hackeliae]KTD11493.1 secretion system protein D [Legionella hackeliae]CEK10674.1 Legionella secretion system protein D [Legionella hackeliae]STX47421.1 HlyD family secretion protein [Legionella hackeliae]
MKYQEKSHLFTHIILWSSILFVVCALIWAHYAILDEVTSGQGKVIPSSQIQIIQNLEGGIVSKLYVQEGEIVKKNQILMQIDNTRFMATYNEAGKKMASLEIAVIRLSAEMNNKPMEVPPEFLKNNPDLVEAEKALYESRQEELRQLNSALGYAQKELDLSKPLVSKGAVSEVEIMRLERSVNELKGKIYQFKSQALEQLNKAKGELAALKESQQADKDRLVRTTVRSPVKGVVKRIKVNTIGGVIQPGMDIIEIVPLDDTLLIEAKIRPSDIGFIHPGQKAIVKLSAYEFPIYGGLTGKVEQISADTITDEKSTSGKEETYYLIRVRTEKNYLGTEGKPLYIIPGMMATVDILTGKKSVLQYLLKPILKAREAALRER